MAIALDYDGTIADTNREKVKWIARNLGIAVAPWMCSRTDCVPIIGRDAYERMGNYVYERENTLEADDVPGALDALRALSARTELHIVTARPGRRVAYAGEWLERHGVMSCIDRVHSSVGSSKEEICAQIGAGVLVDDDVRHLADLNNEGLTRVLLQDGRTGLPEPPPGIVFCRSWGEVLGFMESELERQC